jgi:hypothetical protein
MKKMILKAGMPFAMAALCLLFAACGDSGKGGPAQAENPKSAATQAIPQPAAPSAAPAVSPKPTGTGTAMSCYEIGFRTGRCVAKSMSGLPCDAGDEIPMPPECKGKPETEKGLLEGRKSVY